MASLLFTAIATVGATLAWMSSTAFMQNSHNPIKGTVEDAYYASGTGTANDPYIITRPRHLYNLAWLQLLGYYNKTSDDDHPFYFKLGDNINMGDYCPIPPIGTETYPFAGNFDGNGYVISNLTVSNKFSDFTYHPSVIQEWENSGYRSQPHILGLFGVVGQYTGGTMPHGYSSATNEFINTGITGATIKTELNSVLMGVAAGCVIDGDTTDTHNVMKNIIVDNSNISLPTSGETSTYGGKTTNISDYTLVGYTNNKSSVARASKTMYGINVDTNMTFNATEDGNENGWGGSIDMKSVLTRLQKIRDDNTTASTFAYKKRYTVTDGVKSNSYTPTNSTDNRTYAYADDVNHPEWGHFHFMADGESDRNYYALMGGGHLEIDDNYEYYEYNTFQITNGTQYLRVVSTTIDKTTTQTDGSRWALINNNYLVTKSGDTYYYLRNNNGTLAVTTSTNNASAWTIDDSGTNRKISSGNYAITYSNDSFRLTSGTATGNTTNPYSIRYQNNSAYMYYDNSRTVVNSTTEQKIWNFSSTSGNTTISTNIGGTTYYLKPQNINSSETVILDTSSTNWTWGTSGQHKTLTVAGAGNNTYCKLSYYPSTDEWYLSKNNYFLKLTISGTAEYTFSVNITKSAYSSTDKLKGPGTYLASTTSKMNYEEDDVTYFPLTTVNNTGNYNPADNNTAYIVAGSSITENTSTYTASLSNVRFASYYDISGNISNDYNATTGKFTNIYTVNDSMARESIFSNTSDYERLSDAMSSLGAVMKGQSKTYGLHFMESTISMDAITEATYVKVNNVEKHNYELPVNSIDFNLKEFGYVNFIAGSYFVQTSGDQLRNNSFFSLYQIERTAENPNKINRILEIKNVYQHTSKTKNYSFVYELTDGTDTFFTKPYKVTSSEGGREWLYDTENDYEINQYVDSLPANYSKVFNVDRIKKNNIASGTFDKHVYYFEIPMNDGEFCLGSVEGGIGSYLMYLDIGANAAKTNRTITYQKFTLDEKTYSYPSGVSLGALPTTYTSGTATININSTVDASDSACMEVKATANGVYSIDRDANKAILNRSTQSKASPIYAGELVTIHEGSASAEAINPVPLSTKSYEIRRMTYYDYSVNSDTLCVTTFTDYYETVDDEEVITRVIEQSKYSGTSPSGTPTSTKRYDPTATTPIDERADIRIYNTSNGVRYLDSEVISPTAIPIANNKLNGTLVLEFTLDQDGGDTYTDATKILVVVDTSISETETYYKYNGFEITLTPDSGTIVVKVEDYGSSFTITIVNINGSSSSTSNATTTITINGTTVTGTIGQEITIPAP